MSSSFVKEHTRLGEGRMGYGYSLDLRQRALGAVSRGEGTYQDIAARYEIGTATLPRWCRRQHERGNVAALPHGGG